MPSEQGTRSGDASALLEPFRAAPESAAVLTDVDGTLAPIVSRPEQAAVPAAATEALRRLSERFAVVGCVSGRQVEEARRLVGLSELAYAGNHGMEVLWPGEGAASPSRGALEWEPRVRELVASVARGPLGTAGLRPEDKGPIQALHWRGAADEAAAEARAREIAKAAEADGLAIHWGRKVLELRPPLAIGKDIAVAELLSRARPRHALYAGDDRTDLDAFAGLRAMRERGELESAVCVGVLSAEGPSELARESDLTVDGPAGWLAILEALAR
ncbi:MAG TPA: trehalose-phosphatase [Solirubrobacterales bacterium]|nr:trehalose-phosphatase [Solirubrobacterales bacterium]